MKSPIELRLRDALRIVVPGISMCDFTDCGPPHGFDLASKSAFWRDCVAVSRMRSFGLESDDRYQEVGMSADVAILSYRADLYLECDRFGLVIECDGHDFHDRTKQQAAYDRSRDRDLLKHDIATIRFTGSEIFHSAERCAADVWEIVAMFDRRSADAQQSFSSGWKAGQKHEQQKQADCGVGALAGVI